MGMTKDPNSLAGKIRAYIAANPKATAKEIAEALNCKVQRVYTVQSKNRLKARTVKAAWRARKKAQASKLMKRGFPGTSGSDLPNPGIELIDRTIADLESGKNKREKELVNSPSHYTFGGIETIKFIEAKLSPEEFRGYLKGNVLKYGSRLGHKGDMKIDAGKLAWYSSHLKEVLEKT